jgi:ribosome-associated translation inhibitor RaiA
MTIRTTFRHLRRSAELERDVEARAAKLLTFDPRLIGCRVLLEVPHRRRRHGNPVHVRIELQLPGDDIVVSVEGEDGMPQGIHDAFDAARRRLEDEIRKTRDTTDRATS